MFQNPDTLLLEIIVLIVVILFLGALLGIYIYKKRHNIPTGDCASCANKKNALLKAYRKKYKKEENAK